MSEHSPQTTGFLTPRIVRLLIVAIIVMTAFIIAGVIALIWGIKTKLEQIELQPPIMLEMSITLGADEKLSGYQLSDDGVWLQIDTKQGTKLLHLDANGVATRNISVK
jgi:uncharacterized metal-binding protein